MVFKNELYPIHFYGRVRGKCDGRLQNWPGIANERPKFLAMQRNHALCVSIDSVKSGRTDTQVLQTSQVPTPFHLTTTHTQAVSNRQ